MRKLGKKNRRLLFVYFVCAACAAYSFFLPWVSITPAVPVHNFYREDRAWHEWIHKRLIVVSYHKIINVSLKNKPRVVYEGYRIPPAVWRMKKNAVTGKFLWLSGRKNLCFQVSTVYLYPVFIAAAGLLLYRFRFVRKFHAVAGIGFCAVAAVQFFIVGLYDAYSLPVAVYLDYGFWIGAAVYSIAGIYSVHN